MKKISLFIVLLIFIPTVNAQGLYTGKAHNFNILPDYVFSAQSKAPLIWEADGNETVQVLITVTTLPDNISSIVIDAITFSTFITDDVKEVGTQVGFASLVPQDSISKIGVEYGFNTSIESPVLGDNFYLNITILARTTGNSTQSSSNNYSYRFPVDDTILVSHESDLVPLINLYGFPPQSFFQSWMPIYLITMVIVLFPGFVSGGFWVKNKIKKEEEL